MLEKQDAIFDCILIGFNYQVIHKKKRQVKGSLRQKIAGCLVDGKNQATVWHTEEAMRIKDWR